MIRKAILLPAAFAVVVVPTAWFVASGAGTHMSPLLLYSPAAPWWMFFRYDTAHEELRILLAGCAINFVLLFLAGLAWDRYAQRRRTEAAQ